MHKKRPTHLKLYYSGTESSCSPKSNSTSTSVSTGTSSAASPGLESPGKMLHSSPRGGSSPRTPRSPRIKLEATGNVKTFVKLIFFLYARWRFKIVCLQTKLASLAICKKSNYLLQIQFSTNVARFARRNLNFYIDFELQFSTNVARFARKDLISVDFEVQFSTKVARFARVRI